MCPGLLNARIRRATPASSLVALLFLTICCGRRRDATSPPPPPPPLLLLDWRGVETHPHLDWSPLSLMKEAFHPPTSALTTTPVTENGTSSCLRNNIRNDVVAERGSISSYQPWDSMKCKEDTHFLVSHQVVSVNRCWISGYTSDVHLINIAIEQFFLFSNYVLRQEYQAQSSYSNYATALGSHACSKEAMSLGSEYHRWQPYFPSSNCSWENSSSALEAVPSSPDSSGHVVGKMRTKSKIFGPRPDYLASYPTTGPHMRRSYPAAAKVDFSLDYHSDHRYRRSDHFTAVSNCNGRSIERHNEIVDLPRETHFADETTSFSTRWRFDNGGPSLPRGLEYGDEIPSLSSQKCNGNKALSYSSQWEYGAEIPSLSSRQGYGAEIPSLSSRQGYGDEIPSLSRHWCYRDKIPLHSGRWWHDAEAHPLPSYQQGASHGNGHSRDNFVSSLVSNQQGKMITSNHTVTRPRVPNRVVNSTDHCRINKKDDPWRNSEDIRDQVRGPRANKLNNASTPSTEKDIVSPLVRRDQINRSDFSVQYEHAKFFMIKSYSEDDIHKGIKYNVWASTPNGNNKLDAAFHEAQILLKEKGTKCPVFLLFSVNTSGQFVGLAEMLGPVDFKKTMDFWQQDQWNGFFPVMWHIMKDIPNWLFKHITLENNNNRPVTFSRDTQEIGLPQGLEMLKIFKAYRHGTSILDDFDFYEEKENVRCARKGRNADSMHQDRHSFFGKEEAIFSGDFQSVENLEASMESMSLYETWD